MYFSFSLFSRFNDIKSLKEDYAKCELGDGYYYDVEADNLKKMKFIKNNWEDRSYE